MSMEKLKIPSASESLCCLRVMGTLGVVGRRKPGNRASGNRIDLFQPLFLCQKNMIYMKAGPRAKESLWEAGRKENPKKGGQEEEQRGVIPQETPVAFLFKKNISYLLNKSCSRWCLWAGDRSSV